MRRTLLAATAVSLAALSAPSLHAQAGRTTTRPAAKPAAAPAAAAAGGDMVSVGDKFIGARVTLAGGLTGASIPLGVTGEYIFRDGFADVPGAWGIAATMDFYSLPGSIRFIPFSAQARYHFTIKSAPKFVPYAAAGLGFVSVSGAGPFSRFGSGTYLVVGGGARYFLTPKFALEGTLGLQDAGALSIGGTLKF